MGEALTCGLFQKYVDEFGIRRSDFAVMEAYGQQELRDADAGVVVDVHADGFLHITRYSDAVLVAVSEFDGRYAFFRKGAFGQPFVCLFFEQGRYAGFGGMQQCRAAAEEGEEDGFHEGG